MVGVQNQQHVDRTRKRRVHLVGLGRRREHHLEDVRCIVQIVPRIVERLSDAVLVRTGSDGRKLRQQTVRRHFDLLIVLRVERVLIERGQRTDDRRGDRHRMGVQRERLIHVTNVFVQQRVVGDLVFEFRELRLRGQVTVQDQVRGFQKTTSLS